jgi:membrane-associated phospholipid phosphatase
VKEIGARLARGISILGHPFASILLLVAVYSARRTGPASATQAVLLIGIAILLPLGLFMYLRVRSGRWGTVDASVATERPALFRFVLPLLLAVGAAIAFVWTTRFGFLARGIVSIFVLLAAAALGNRWIKASLHVAFAAYAAVVLLRVAPYAGVAVLVFLPALAWARVAMGRHSWTEVIAGGALGAAVGILTVVL